MVVPLRYWHPSLYEATGTLSLHDTVETFLYIMLLTPFLHDATQSILPSKLVEEDAAVVGM